MVGDACHFRERFGAQAIKHTHTKGSHEVAIPRLRLSEGRAVMRKKKIERDWSKAGLTTKGSKIADQLVPAVTMWLKEIKRRETSRPDLYVDDLAFVAKQVVWQIALEMGMLTNRPPGRKR